MSGNPVGPSGLLISLALTLATCSGQDAMDLFHRMQNALGGSAAISSIHEFEQTVRADAWDFSGRPMGVVRKRVRFVRPTYIRVDQAGPGDTYVLYFDGASGWEILPDGTLADLKGSELTFARNYLRGLDLNLWLADRDSYYVLGSPAANVISIAGKDSSFPASEITLDPATFLPVKQTGTLGADSGRPVSVETRFGQWGAVGGVKFPGVVTKLRNGAKLAEITVEATKLNGGLKPHDLAMKPPDLKPVM